MISIAMIIKTAHIVSVMAVVMVGVLSSVRCVGLKFCMSLIVCMRCSSVCKLETSISDTFIAVVSVSKSVAMFVRFSL